MPRAMIADRRHPHNGEMFTTNGTELRFVERQPMDGFFKELEDDSYTAQKAEVITLYLGTFNGIPVWTAEKVET